MNVNDIARIAHEVDRSHCESLGDFSNKSWHKSTPERRAVVIAGVRRYMADHKDGPQIVHNAWVATMIAQGWVYGEDEDPQKKTHPCLVPFHSLTPIDKSKDFIFHAIVVALMRHHDDYVYLGEDS